MATTWIRSNDIICQDWNGEALLVSAKTGARWSLNATAAAIWKLCDGRMELSELTRRFASASGRSAQVIRREIAALCTQFEEQGLLNICTQSVHDSQFIAATACMSGLSSPPLFQVLGLTSGGARKRPSPRGNSGPG